MINGVDILSMAGLVAVGRYLADFTPLNKAKLIISEAMQHFNSSANDELIRSDRIR